MTVVNVSFDTEFPNAAELVTYIPGTRYKVFSTGQRLWVNCLENRRPVQLSPPTL